MTKNLISIIAKELGVEIDEEFAFETNVVDELVCRFTDKELQMKNHAEEWVKAPISLNYVCQQKVIKLPFKPKVGELYWTYTGETWCVSDTLWEDRAIDYFRKHCGCIFRTEAEAVAALPAKYQTLTGKEWKDG